MLIKKRDSMKMCTCVYLIIELYCLLQRQSHRSHAEMSPSRGTQMSTTSLKCCPRLAGESLLPCLPYGSRQSVQAVQFYQDSSGFKIYYLLILTSLLNRVKYAQPYDLKNLETKLMKFQSSNLLRLPYTRRDNTTSHRLF